MPTRKFTDYAISGLIPSLRVGGETSDYEVLVKQDINLESHDTTTLLHASGIPSNNSVDVITYGLNSIGDNAGGTWHWDSTRNKEDANIGLVVDPSVDFTISAQGTGFGLGCWVRDWDLITVKASWFGVVNDAIWTGSLWTGTDNTDSLHAAQNAVNKYGTLLFSGGACLVTSLYLNKIGKIYKGTGLPTIVDLKNGIYDNLTVLVSNNSTSAPFLLSSGLSNKRKQFFDIGFCGNTNDSIPVVDASNSPKTNFTNIFIYNVGLGDGIKLYDAWLVTFYNCNIYKGDTNIRTGTGINIKNTNLGGLYNFINTTLYGWQTNTIGEETDTPDGEVSNFNFIGSQAKACQNGLELLGGVAGSNIIGSYIESCISKGILVNHGASSIKISGCFLNNPEEVSKDILIGSIPSQNFHSVSIENNYFRSSDGTHVHVSVGLVDVGYGAVRIIGNHFLGSGASSVGIFISGEYFSVFAEHNYYADTLNTKINNPEGLLNTAHVEELSSSKDLDIKHPETNIFSTDGTGRTVRLPNEGESVELLHTKIWRIINADTSGKNITVRTSDNLTTLASIEVNEIYDFVFDGIDFQAIPIRTIDTNEYIRKDIDQTATGALTLDPNTSNPLLLSGGTSDNVYMSFYKYANDKSTRTGYVGYPVSITDTLSLTNEIIGGNVKLQTESTGKCFANSSEIITRSHVEDTAVDGNDDVPISSNWAYDHENATDPHGGPYNNYIHPSYTARTESGDTTALTGATVISDLDFNMASDATGHITAFDITTLATRELTAGDIGAATSGHTHTTWNRASSVLANAAVFSNIVVTNGITTAIATRNLTPADIGAQAAGTYNTIIGTDTDLNTSGAQVIDVITMTDGVIQNAITTRNLTPANIGALAVADIDDTPVDAATTVPISSNWAYDHENAGDPHTQYVRGDAVDNGIVRIVCNDNDFSVEDGTDSVSNFFWRDWSGSKLYIGTVDAVVTLRSNVLPNGHNTYDLGSSSIKWRDVYATNFQTTATGVEISDSANAPELKFDANGTDKVKMVWNNTENSLDYVFI